MNLNLELEYQDYDVIRFSNINVSKLKEKKVAIV